VITLTNAVVPFDGEQIFIEDVSEISEMFIDHSLANSDCTRVVMNNGNEYQVQESMDEIQQMIENESSK
jgi:uncharacterized protein YlzI (FlbEa/FlbD family)